MSDSLYTLVAEIEPHFGATIEPVELNLVEPKVTKVEGPYNEDGELQEYAELGKEYYYYATLNVSTNSIDPKQIKWAAACDTENFEQQHCICSGGEIKNDRILTSICIGRLEKMNRKIDETFKIYAYLGNVKGEGKLEVKLKKQKQVALFFIGGAGDAEPYYFNGPSRIMEKVMELFNNIVDNDRKIKEIYLSEYLGYNKAKGKGDIKENITDKIPNKENTAVYIIGHSLGGWNGAHLSQMLTDKGYNIDLLITLDPVGVDLGVQLVSDIHVTYPNPKCNYWINIYTDPKVYSGDDFIADLGGQWSPPKEKVQINHITRCSHSQAAAMFHEGLNETGISASDMLLHFIKEYISKP